METDPPGLTLYEETFIDFICTASISNAVDTPTSVSLQWEGLTDLIINTDYNITQQTNMSILHFTRLQRNTKYNGRNITCRATVAPSTGTQYVQQNTNEDNVQLTVKGVLYSYNYKFHKKLN